MKLLAPPGSTALRPPSLGLLLAVTLPLWGAAASVAAEDPAQRPTTLRLENSDSRATLTESINAAIVRAQSGDSAKSIRKNGPAQITVRGSLTRSKPRKPGTSKPSQVVQPTTASVSDPAASRRYIEARAAALAGWSPTTPAPLSDPQQVQWNYLGDTGAQAWGKLHPGFATCAQGQQQSPIDIKQGNTVTGPAEPLHMEGAALSGTVVHRGHSIVVEVSSKHTLVLRGLRWQLRRLESHHPAEERIDFQNFPMSADLVYQSLSRAIGALAARRLQPAD
ncbi:MAG: carbonic anhydrase family protein [Comamonadaceae bacterium]|jgi:carbonic anhydrase|nr:carbonic anhydrase family protein [Comamonadaceae bacterium]